MAVIAPQPNIERKTREGGFFRENRNRTRSENTKVDTKKEIEYPSSDGKPMAESGKHVHTLVDIHSLLESLFANDPDVHVAGNNFVYYVEGDLKKVVSPDAYVVFGISKEPRESYKVWEEGGKYPNVIIEVTSKSTSKKDQNEKFHLYESWKVDEYYLYDPNGEYLKPRLQGYRLVDGKYEHIPFENNRLKSKMLGVELVLTITGRLRLFDPITRTYHLNLKEQIEMTQEALQRANAERERAEAAQVRASAEAKARAEAVRKANAEAKARYAAVRIANAERERAEVAEARADSEARLRLEMQIEMEKMRAELAKLQEN